jgi:hypothetical protein
VKHERDVYLSIPVPCSSGRVWVYMEVCIEPTTAKVSDMFEGQNNRVVADVSL